MISDDPRALRLRIMSALTYPMWLSAQELSEKLGDPTYTVSAMLSKLFLYGGPIERKRADWRRNKYVYRFIPKTKT